MARGAAGGGRSAEIDGVIAIPKKLPPSIGELTGDARRLYQILNEESALACVVIGAAFVEAALRTLLEERFARLDVADTLLAPNGALGSAGPRADLAYSLGLVRKPHYDDLRTIARIRNRFAHNHLQLTFADEDIQRQCERLNGWRTLNFTDELETNLSERARSQFNVTTVFVSNGLLVTTLLLQAEKKKNAAESAPAADPPA